ncbi:MAG: biopolymer transporter ExbD [Prevotellaceae bacterium]|jgi:biopolymer transport protein ExbD|nr:biopolymer transporter ExbD [Prevotellaceae bacterium]
MAIKTKLSVDASFPLSSMTDLVFLLLIFFMISATQASPNALRLLLPKSTNTVASKVEITVAIRHYPETDNYSYHINNNQQPVPFNAIEGLLQNYLKDQEEPVISLYVDETVPVKEVVDIMNIAKRNNYKVLLATEPESE